MISIIVPTRDRPDGLQKGLDSLGLAEHGLEALVWLDDDDPKLERYKELFQSNPNVKLFIKPRVGYAKFHLMMNWLTSQAKYDWIFEFNDDAYMDNPDWFGIFSDFVKQFEPASQPVVINIWGQGVSISNLFPIVSRAYFDAVGHFSLSPNCDDWIRLVGVGANISHDLKGIKPKHRKYGGDDDILKDETFQEVEKDRAELKKTWNERRHVLPEQLLNDDINKLIEYKLSAKQKVKHAPGLSVLAPTRARAKHLKLSLDSLGLEENNLEALVWIDDDDPQLEDYRKLLGKNERIRLFVKARVGYQGFHEMLNFLAGESVGDWLMLWNDDSYMDGPEWYKTFAEHAGLVDPKEEPVVFNIWGQGETENFFPIVSRKYFELLQHMSEVALCDTWIKEVAWHARIQRTIFGIKPNHRKFDQDEKMGALMDQTTLETAAEWEKNKWFGFYSEASKTKRWEDINKIIESTPKRHAGFIGLGKLGLPVALAMENRGNRIVGYDIDDNLRTVLRNKNPRKIPYSEEEVGKLRKSLQLDIVDSIKEMVQKTDLIFCAVQTPHDPRFEGDKPLPEDRADFDYSYLKSAVKAVADAAKELGKKITLVVISTCLPGTYKRDIKPLLTPNINYVYNPYFIAMGTVVNDFYSPEFVLIGKDSGDTAPLENFYKLTLGPQKVFVTDITTAEGIKVFYNTYITAKTVLGNMYGEFAHKLGMNVDHIHEALSLATDGLMSPRYLKAGVGDGGSCHPRDNIALSHLADKYGLSFNIFEHLMTAREKHMEWLGELLKKEIRASGLRGIILGKSFKPESDIETGSAAILLANLLREQGLEFEHYEFDLPDELERAVYLIATNHGRYSQIPFPAGSIVIDPFRYIPQIQGVKLISVGKPA